MVKFGLLTIILILSFNSLHAAGGELELEDLILDQTRARTGREFYAEFAARMATLEGVSGYTIVIKEFPDPRWGSLVVVHVDDSPVFRSILGRRPGEIKAAVEKGIGATLDYLIRRSIDSKSLEKGDLSGSGFR